ncbi:MULTISPECIES: hypothetical protein [unclassified Pseudomonas]|uniref:hypothetical protein n=1 Tax=unclassified Pseudomonas TaxID=196821 RepID=UPI0015B17DD2|nr:MULTISPECIES: hypothetical protein [unclassified Pseudomonas]
MEGNQILSAKNEVNGQILRVVLDEDVHELCSCRDKEAEMFYNAKRRHGFNNQLSPVEFEKRYVVAS